MGKRKTIGARAGVARAVVLGGAVGFLTVGATGCSDSSVEPENVETVTTAAGETSEVVVGLTGDAGVSSSDIPGFREIIEQYEGRLGEPGVVWYLAADLQAALTSEQIAAIAAFQDELGQRVRERAAERSGEPGTRKRPMRGRGDGGFGERGDGPDLTEDQRAQIEEIREQFAPEFDRLKESIASGSLDRETAREQMDALREAVRAEIEAILTDDQREQIEARQADREARRDNRDAAREVEREAMRDALDLTAEQITALEALRSAAAESDVSREALREAHRAAFVEILSDAQEEIVVLHRALTSRLRIRRSGVDGDGGAGPGHRGPGPRGGFGPDGSAPSDG